MPRLCWYKSIPELSKKSLAEEACPEVQADTGSKPYFWSIAVPFSDSTRAINAYTSKAITHLVPRRLAFRKYKYLLLDF